MTRGALWLVEPLASHHDRAAFSCGTEPLDRYVQRQARQDARRHVAATFVAVPAAGEVLVGGYYTLSAFGVEPGELPDATVRRLPRYPLLPATLLGRLAVDHRHKGEGLGRFLLIDALLRAYGQTDQVASTAVVVDAIDDQARRFYEHFDFLPFPERRNRLFLPMSTIARLFPEKLPHPG